MMHTPDVKHRSQRRSSRRSSPHGRGNPSPNDADDSGAEVRYEDLFGTPPLQNEQEQQCPFRLGIPGDSAPDPPSLGISAYPPERAGYELAFQAAYEFPHAMMLVMRGIRKGLKRGKEAAERGDQSC